MARGALIICLLFLFVFLAKGFSASWKVEEIPPAAPPKQALQKTTEPFAKIPSPYPAVPASLPDFNKGYLFNESRELSVAADGDEAESSEDDVQLNDIMYAGSIIVGDEKKGLLAIAATPPRPTRSSSKRRPTPANHTRVTVSQAKYRQVVVGDEVSGYTVSEIHPDRIVFAKNGRTIEKSLYDAEKKRVAPRRKRTTAKKSIAPKRPPVAVRNGSKGTDPRVKATKSSSLRTQSSPALRRPRPQSTSSPIPKGLRIPTVDIAPPEGTQHK